MTEWAFVIATKEYDCPHCGAKKGEYCKMPSGRDARTPHGKRVHQLTSGDWQRCTGTAVTLEDTMTRIGNLLNRAHSD
jgi:hypothetical protein